MDDDIEEVAKEAAAIAIQRSVSEVPRTYITNMCRHINDVVFIDLGKFVSFTSISQDCARDLGERCCSTP